VYARVQATPAARVVHATDRRNPYTRALSFSSTCDSVDLSLRRVKAGREKRQTRERERKRKRKREYVDPRVHRAVGARCAHAREQADGRTEGSREGRGS
jgi:hypothetical protein